MGQALPETPLSVGSKLELFLEDFLSLPNFRILPRTLTLLSAYILYAYYRACKCMLRQRRRGLCTSVPSFTMANVHKVNCFYIYMYMYV